MKLTIDVTEEQLKYLQELQNDFAIQQANNQSRYPNVYTLFDLKEVVVDPDFESNYDVKYCIPDIGEYDIPADELQSYLEKNYQSEIKEYLLNHEDFDWESEDDIEQLLEELSSPVYKNHVSWQDKEVQTFLTRNSAEEHLKSNSHHYHKNATIVRQKLWRNPLMDSLILMLYNIDLQAVVKE